MPALPPGYGITEDEYQDWVLTHRPAMLPFLAEYTNAQTGERSGGMAVPSMVTEVYDAGKRFFSPGGGFENNPTDQSARDAQTLLMSIYGGNALSGMARGSAASRVAQALSDTSKPNPVGAGIAGGGDSRILGPNDYIPQSVYENVKRASQTRAGYSNTPTRFHKDYMPPTRDLDDFDREFAQFTNTIAVEFPNNDALSFADQYEKALAAQAWRDKVKRTGELFSDTSRPSLLGSAIAAQPGEPNDPLSFMGWGRR